MSLLAAPLTVPFPFYRRLTAPQKAIYRASAAIPTVELPRPTAARELVGPVRDALATGDRRRVVGAVTVLVAELVSQLEVPAVKVRVLAVRPASSRSELHGLYERAPGETAILRVWMRTAVHARVVSFRTFLRTVMHELCHHLDYELFELADSYHTEGFFQRESSLTRQLAPNRGRSPETPAPAARRDAKSVASKPRATKVSAEGEKAAAANQASVGAAAGQLALPFDRV